MAETRRLSRLAEPAMTAMAAVPSGPVVVALSGGADSAAAAWVSQASNRPTRAVHVHHGLAHSDMLAGAAAGVADRLEIDFDMVRVEVPAGASMELQARRARLGALEAAARSGEWVVTGHTRDDQVETLLMRLVRGTGLDGLAGIPAIRHPFVRPLLGLTRSSTRELATLAGLAWRDDPENLAPYHLRNRIRTSLIPAMEGTFGTAPAESLVRMARLIADDVAVLEEVARSLPFERRPGEVRLAIGAMLAVPPAVAARAIRAAFVELEPPYPPSAAVAADVLAVAGGRPGSAGAGGVSARRSGPWLVLSVPGPAEPPASCSIPVPGSGSWGGIRIDVTVGPRPAVIPLSSLALVMPAPGVSHLTVRAATRDDLIPLVRGHKRVTDALAEAGVPVEARGSHPVVVAGDKVVWIPGVRRAGWAVEPEGSYLCAVAMEEAQWQRYER
ncbi:MAG: tRNA lysidine(34) synthetase TilS [Acidimicrobiia bacterium]